MKYFTQNQTHIKRFYFTHFLNKLFELCHVFANKLLLVTPHLLHVYNAFNKHWKCQKTVLTLITFIYYRAIKCVFVNVCVLHVQLSFLAGLISLIDTLFCLCKRHCDSGLDYCNPPLTRLLMSCLTLHLIAASCLVFNQPKCCQIIPLLCCFQWHPIAAPIQSRPMSCNKAAFESQNSLIFNEIIKGWWRHITKISVHTAVHPDIWHSFIFLILLFYLYVYFKNSCSQLSLTLCKVLLMLWYSHYNVGKCSRNTTFPWYI